MENRVKKIILNLGADLCNIANIDRFKDTPKGFHPTDIYSDCKSVVVYAMAIPKGLSFVSPRITYKMTSNTVQNELDRVNIKACLEIEKLGGIAVPLPSDDPYDCWDSEKMEGRGILSMRHAALLSGLGSMGKNTLIINKKYGNMINISAILTNLDLKSDPLSEKLCKDNCRICLDSCPTGALDGKTATQKLCREHTYVNNARGFSVCNCNTCRVVCPLSFGI